ncbi:MAG: hypothetical protein HY721_23775 [Planctomycetes bacterium]|nr:hypothetical protein [Planctomycetota bacterium]
MPRPLASASAVLLASSLACVPAPQASAEAPPETWLRAWAAAALWGEAPPPLPSPPGLEVRRQDHCDLRLRRSVLDTPLRLGERR